MGLGAVLPGKGGKFLNSELASYSQFVIVDIFG